jgi:hypothetical protein
MKEENVMNELEREPEIWAPISGYEGLYEISSWGNIKTLSRTYYSGKDHNIKKEIVEKNLKLGKDKDGYPQTILYKDGIPKTVRAHQLVAQYFVVNPDPENLTVPNHDDGVKYNNYYKNIRWSTPQQNTLHAYANNLAVALKGEEHNMAKLTNEDVNVIREENEYRGVLTALAKKFNVSISQIRRIRKKINWAHVPANR